MTMEEQRLITAVCTADFPWSASDCSPSFRPIQQNLIAYLHFISYSCLPFHDQ
eukprot:m.455265 g.455265  ORF g.455265 m.455265 type:complete len:53 (+) comp56958_c1_seq27:1341-1499(+)